MRYVAAYLLASLGGNKNPSTSDLEKILGSVGIEVDLERAKKVIAELKGKDVEEVIESGKSKLASMPAGGGGVVVSGGGGAAAAGEPAKEEAKKEEKKEESEESDDDMGFGLFD